MRGFNYVNIYATIKFNYDSRFSFFNGVFNLNE